jgi:hypothetical protein
MEEEWRPVLEFPTHEVSNHGRVRRGGKMLTPTLKKVGYYLIDICVGGKENWRYLHRLLAEAFLPRQEGRDFVDHKNQVKTDNRLENLHWVTRSENQANHPIRSDNTTGHKNITLLPSGAFWLKVKRNKVFVIRKAYPTLDEAIVARNSFLGS